MKILVTGGAGYLGATLVPLLLEHGHAVTVVDVLRFGIEPMLPLFRHPRFSFVHADVRDRTALASHTRSADAFVHLAALVGYPACAREPKDAQSVNVEGSRNLGVAVGRGRPLIFTSTSSCYGAVANAVCTEDTPLRPLSDYGRTKAEAEAILLDQCDAVIYRVATAFGLSPRLRLDLLVNDFTYRALRDHRLTVYEGHYRRSFLHVYDIARAILLALDRSAEMVGRTFNVGDENQNCTKLDICRTIAKIIPGVTIEDSATGQDMDRRDYVVSYAKIAALNFHATISLDSGIRELAAALPWVTRCDDHANVC
jgi:nucleoside-diphosphate-sugar epimerase